MQDRINYENAILRNKILSAMQEAKKSTSMSKAERRNPFRTANQEEMYQTNVKMGQRLSNIRSDLSLHGTKRDFQILRNFSHE